MFKTNQIISKTDLLKSFELVARHLESHPQALLITRRQGVHLVLVNAQIWESFLLERFERDSENGTPTPLRSEISPPFLRG